MLASLLSALYAISLPAIGADIAHFSYSTYPTSGSLSGTDGWVSGYSGDGWQGVRGSSSGRYYAASKTDDNGGSFGGASDACDNTLTNEEIAVSQGWMKTSFYTEDDDAIGLVFNWTDSGNYYLFLMLGEEVSSSGASAPIDVDPEWAGIVRIRDGVAEILTETDQTYTRNQVQRVSMGRSGDEIWVTVDTDYDSGREAFSLSATDPRAILGVGRAGFYAYDAGDSGDNSRAMFGPIEVWATDSDGDGVADDDESGGDGGGSGDGGGDGGGSGDGGAGDGGAGDGGAGDGGAGDGGAGDGGAGDGGAGDGGGDGGAGDGGRDGEMTDEVARLTACAGCAVGGGAGAFGWGLGLLALWRRRRG